MRWFAFVVGLLVSGAAHAGDLVISADGPSAVADWTGAHVGVTAGVGASNGKATRGAVSGVLLPYDVGNGLFPDSIARSRNGMIGGLSAGYDHQVGKLVGGVAGDINFGSMKLRHSLSMPDPNPNPPFTGVDTNTTYETKYGLLATARLRAGIAVRDSLVYATGGVAYGKVTNRVTLAIPQLGYTSPDWSADKARFGYVVGAGVETKITQNLRLRLEGLAVDLQDSVVHATDPATFPGESIDYRFANRMLIGRVGLVYSF